MPNDLFDRIRLQAGQETPLTPLQANAGLSTALGCEVLLKCEHMAPSGSFKYRGATAKFVQLGADAHAGVVTASTGNHGKAIAMIAAQHGVPATVFAPASAEASKIQALRALGADVKLVQSDPLETEADARQYALYRGQHYISPYNDADVVLGNSAVGREIVEQAPHVEAIFLAVGGGGLLSGVGLAAKSLKPDVQIVGCWPANADSLYQVIVENAAHPRPERPTLSDATLGGAEDGAITIDLAKSVMDLAIRVSEAEIAEAMGLIHAEAGHKVEGAAGVALAALKQRAGDFNGRSVAVVLCGGNIDPLLFQRTIAVR